MMALAGNSSFENVEMEAIWTVLKACITPAITYSGEAWEPSKKNYHSANQIMDGVLKRILKTPTHGTSREALYIETGIMDPEALIIKNRINMEARIKNGNNQTMKDILKSKTKGSWAEENRKLKERLNLDENQMEGSRAQIKAISKTKIKQDFKERINNEMNEKSKMKYFMDGKKDWEPMKPAEYTQKLPRNQVSTIFKARTRMLKVRSNYKKGNKEHKCRLCKHHEETQQHVLEECEKINERCQKVSKEMIFNEDITELRKTAKTIQKRMELLEELENKNEEQMSTHTLEMDNNALPPRVNTDHDETLPYGEEINLGTEAEELRETLNPDLDETLPYGEDNDNITEGLRES